MYFDQLLHFSDPDHIDIALVFTTANSDIVYFAHSEDVALSHDAVKYIKSECIDEIEHFFLGANEKHVVDHQRVPHVLNVQSLHFARVPSLEHIDFVLGVHNQNMVLAYGVHVAGRLA